ncbi:MAG TPA: hypothetical protein VGM68_05630 [Rhizomicrobium sp.]|jgi:hypothetical protein
MAVLDHDHSHHLDGVKPSLVGVPQFCLFWVAMFAAVALIGMLLKG